MSVIKTSVEFWIETIHKKSKRAMKTTDLQTIRVRLLQKCVKQLNESYDNFYVYLEG